MHLFLKNFFLPPISQQLKDSLLFKPWLHLASWTFFLPLVSIVTHTSSLLTFAYFKYSSACWRKQPAFPASALPYHLLLKSVLTFLAPRLFSFPSSKFPIPQSMVSPAVAGANPVPGWGSSRSLWLRAPMIKYLINPAAISKLPWAGSHI